MTAEATPTDYVAAYMAAQADPTWQIAHADYLTASERGRSAIERKRLRGDTIGRMYEIEAHYERVSIPLATHAVNGGAAVPTPRAG